MKKVISLVLAACMLLMGIPALAGQQADRVVLQDEKAPEIIVAGEENGVVVVATVYDADGNVVGQVAEGSLVLVDAHDRNNIADEAAAKRLNDAFSGAMSYVHYSDAASAHHDGTIKVDLNAALAGNADGLIAYDLINFELFDVTLTGDAAALLGEGCYLELTIQLGKGQSMPMFVIFTADGTEWEILKNYTFGDNKTMTLRLEKPGTLAFLAPVYTASVEEVEYPVDTLEDSIEIIEDEQIEDSPFTPSVSGKPAPSVVPTVDENGEEIAGTVIYTDSDMTAAIPAGWYLIVTPFAERDFVLDIQTHEHLEWSFDDVLAAGHVGELEEGIDDEINAALAAGGFELTYEDMVMRDLFEISVYGEYVEHFYNEHAVLEITFDAGIAQDEAFVVLFSNDAATWHVLPAENVKVNANGTVTLRLSDLGTIAFLIERVDDVFAADDAVLSPE